MKTLKLLLTTLLVGIFLAACGGEEEAKGPEFLVPELQESIEKSNSTLLGIWGSHTEYVHLKDPEKITLESGQLAYVFTYKAKNNYKESVVEITVKRGTGGKQESYLAYISDQVTIDDGGSSTSYN